MAKVKILIEDVNNSVEPIILNNRNLISLESSSQYASDNGISYSVIPNSGKVELTDHDGSLYNKLNPKNYPNGMLLSLYLNNNLIQRHIIKDSSYNVHDRKINLSLTNGLEGLDTPLGRIYMLDNNGNRTFDARSLYRVFERMMSIIGISNINDMMTEYVIRGSDNSRVTVQDYLGSISVSYAYLEPATIRENIEKICAVAQLNFIEDDNGQMKFVDARPVFYESEQTPIVVNINNIYEPLSYDPFSPMIVEDVGYVKKTLSTTNYVKVADMSLNLYEQISPNVTSGGLTTGYSGTLSSYTYNKQVSGDSSVIGEYTDPNDSKNKVVLCKTRILFNDDLISTWNRFQIKIINCSYNTLPTPLPTSTNSSNILVNKDQYDVVTNSTYLPGIFFYPNETQAIESFSRVNYPFTQLSVVKSETYYDVYYTLFRYISHTTSTPSGYTGDIDRIYLNYNVEFYVPSLSSIETDINANSKYMLPNNELMHTSIKYSNDSIYNEQAGNVIRDYASGMLSGTVSIGFADYYDEDGNLKINSTLGQIVNEGDILYFPYDTKITGEEKYWKVSTRGFTFNGRPLLSLNVTQARNLGEIPVPPTPIKSGLYNNEHNLILEWDTIAGSNYKTRLFGLARVPDGERDPLCITPTTSKPDEIGAYLVLGDSVYDSDTASMSTYAGITDFWNLVNLKGISNFPSSGKFSITFQCFSGCINLEDVDLTNVTTIRTNAFLNCSSLHNIFIPVSVSVIDYNAFLNCPNDITIYCEASSKPSYWDANWDNITTNGTKANVKWGYTKEQYEKETNK